MITSDGDDLLVDFKSDLNPNKPFDKEINQYIKFDGQDDLLILSHAEFTRICDKNRDLKKFTWLVPKIGQFDSGMYHVNIRIEDLSDRFNTFYAYFRLTICMKKTNEKIDSLNEVIDISN